MAIKELSKTFLTAVFDLWFPPLCCFCEAPLPSPWSGPLLCPDCRQTLWEEDAPERSCPRCALPTAGQCPDCRRRKFRFQAARVLGVYEKELREAVIRCKLRQHSALAMAFGKTLAERLAEDEVFSRLDYLVPIPSYWTRRLRLRRQHSPDLLAEVISARLKAPFSSLLYCRRFAKKQALLTQTERWRNLRGAFGVRKKHKVRGARILLIDDVITTGATMNEAAKVLKEAGAAKVVATAIARGV